MPAALATLGPVPAASALARLLPTAVGGALGSSGTYLLGLGWPDSWGGPLRSALVATVIGCLFAGIAVGIPHSWRTVRALLVGLGAGSTGLSLLVLPGVMETTAWRGVIYLAATAVAAIAATMTGNLLGSGITRLAKHGSPTPGTRPRDPADSGRDSELRSVDRSDDLNPLHPDAITTPLRVVPRPVPQRARRGPR